MRDLGSGRWAFVVEADYASESVLRVLNPCLVVGAILVAVAMDRTSRGVRIRIEAEALDERRARTLSARLQAIPEVRSVALGWCGSAAEAA